MPRLLFAQLLLLGLGLGPRGAAAMRSKAKGEPAQLHSSSASQDLGGECPLAKEWQDACYEKLGSPLDERESNDCKNAKGKLSNGKKYWCKVAYACTDNAKTKLVEGNGGKVIGWDLTHCQGLSGVTARKMCMAPPEASNICPLEPEKVQKKIKQELAQKVKDQEAVAESLPEEGEEEEELKKKNYECRCTGWKENDVQAVWVSKTTVPAHLYLDFRKKLWAGGGIADLDSDSPCACLAGSWYYSFYDSNSGTCSSKVKTQTFPRGGAVWSLWGEWNTKCEEKCKQGGDVIPPGAKVVENLCE